MRAIYENKVFLGGTCNNSTWRDVLIPMLKVPYFNPVVKDWTPECQEEELYQREACALIFYGITKEMKGAYSIAEVVDDSNKRAGRVFLWINYDGFDESQKKSLQAVSDMVEKNGATVVYSLKEAANIFNYAINGKL